MARAHSSWACTECGYLAPRWLGRCPDCGSFATMIEEAGEHGSPASSRAAEPGNPVSLGDVCLDGDVRLATGIAELDRVVGGGFVAGSIVLLGGEPGIGKSTLLLQAAAAAAAAGADVMYVCGEESPAQVALKARRLGVDGSAVGLLDDTDVGRVEATVRAKRPGMLVVDSIQTVYDPDVAGLAGSVAQIRACTARLMRLAKNEGVTTLIVGHVTKDGSIAGPRMLEHMVDAVLYFEGDRDHAFRIVRSVKNRFGPAGEIGVFEMTDRGLLAVEQPSASAMAGRPGAVGSAVMAAMEGSRPMMVEVQALVAPSYASAPRRLATGVDTGRLLQVLAVLERHAKIVFGQHDVYVALSGGIRVVEPAADLALAMALTSARVALPVPAEMVAFGEIGLTGEIRGVPHIEARLREAARLGFRTAVTGRGGADPRSAVPSGLELHRVFSLEEALKVPGLAG